MATDPMWVFENYAFAAAAIDELEDEIAKLRGLVPEPTPRPPVGEGMPRYGLRWNGPSQPVSVPMADGYWTPWHLADAERDTLLQQLAERDAQIASMRAEVTPFIETHWMPVARQRDKLAGLLREVGDWIDRTSFHGTDAVDLMQRIDAALDEVKPCPESPHPATT